MEKTVLRRCHRLATVPGPFQRLRFSRPILASWPMRRIPVQEIEIELGIGETVQIGDHVYIVLDIEKDEVCFRLVPIEEFSQAPATAPPGK